MVSSSVAGKNVPIAALVGMRAVCDHPRSPRASSLSQIQYCTCAGLSSPYLRMIPSLVEHGVVVPPLHPRAHHDKSRPVDEVDGRDVLVRELLEPEVELLPLLRIGLPGGLLDQPVRFGILVPLGLGE